jgi:TonB family protein
MNVDQKTGAVTSVEILQSSGHKILDKAATDTFSRWRFKPGAVAPKVKTPVTWTQEIPQYRTDSN